MNQDTPPEIASFDFAEFASARRGGASKYEVLGRMEGPPLVQNAIAIDNGFAGDALSRHSVDDVPNTVRGAGPNYRAPQPKQEQPMPASITAKSEGTCSSCGDGAVEYTPLRSRRNEAGFGNGTLLGIGSSGDDSGLVAGREPMMSGDLDSLEGTGFDASLGLQIPLPDGAIRPARGTFASKIGMSFAFPQLQFGPVLNAKAPITLPNDSIQFNESAGGAGGQATPQLGSLSETSQFSGSVSPEDMAGVLMQADARKFPLTRKERLEKLRQIAKKIRERSEKPKDSEPDFSDSQPNIFEQVLGLLAFLKYMSEGDVDAALNDKGALFWLKILLGIFVDDPEDLWHPSVILPYRNWRNLLRNDPNNSWVKDYERIEDYTALDRTKTGPGCGSDEQISVFYDVNVGYDLVFKQEVVVKTEYASSYESCNQYSLALPALILDAAVKEFVEIADEGKWSQKLCDFTVRCTDPFKPVCRPDVKVAKAVYDPWELNVAQARVDNGAVIPPEKEDLGDGTTKIVKHCSISSLKVRLYLDITCPCVEDTF